MIIGLTNESCCLTFFAKTGLKYINCWNYKRKHEKSYVHGYDHREKIRLQDQASTLVELLHSDTSYPAGSLVLEAGCGVGAQTVTLAKNSPMLLLLQLIYLGPRLLKPEEKLQRQA